MKRWNGQTADSKRRIEFTVELLEHLGASGKSQRALAKELGVSQQWLSKQINLNWTNYKAYERGKLKNNGTVTS
jgi:DNA-binding XRE family transcriptional regulator